MKAKDLQDLRGLSAVEMEKKVVELKGELFNLRFQLATGDRKSVV